MIVSGSTRYSPSGRKRKTFKTTVKKKAEFVPMEVNRWTAINPLFEQYEKDKIKYKSKKFEPTGIRSVEDTSYRQEISKQFTVAPAYNKGAYQVIPNSDIEHIGK